MPSYVLTDGTSVVSLNPDYDLKMDHRKIESSLRTRTGANYKYRWGGYSRAMLKVEFLSSADMSQVNSWWSANTLLRLFDMGSSVVVSGTIAGASAPIDSFVAPYTDMYKGTITLEGS
jgi:hypothetical protein